MSVDLLSLLPEALIFLILLFLEMRDVVKTTLLSKAWRDLWTTIPSLDFDETAKSVVQSRNFINRVLLRWNGTRISSLKITFGKAYDASLCGDVDRWISFAVEKKVEELDLLQLAYNPWIPDPVHVLPQCLYSCSSLTKLSLLGFSCRIHDVQRWDWDRLEKLMFIGQCTSEDFVNQLFSSSPKLEIMQAYLYSSHQKLDIESSSLKKLGLITGLHDQSNYTALTIRAPNLESLEISGQYSPCLLSNAPSLTHASLSFTGTCLLRAEAALKQLLPAVQQVEDLELSLSCFKMLGVMEDEYSFPNVKKLKLCSGPIEPNDVVGITQHFPKVEKLLIAWRCDNHNPLFLENLSQMHDIGAKDLKPLPMQLRILELCWHTSDAANVHKIFQFIEFVLEHASMLQKIVIKRRTNNVVQSEVKDLALEKGRSLRRSFPSIDIIFKI